MSDHTVDTLDILSVGPAFNAKTILGRFEGFFFQAKAMNSSFFRGLDASAIVKLSVYSTPVWNKQAELCNYDRGFKHNSLSEDFLERLVSKLEERFKLDARLILGEAIKQYQQGCES